MAIILSLNCPQCGNADNVCPSTFLAEGSCFCVRCGLWFTPLQAGHWEVCGKEKVWVTSSVQPKTEGAKFEGPATKERQDIEDAGKRIKEIIVNGIKQANDLLETKESDKPRSWRKRLEQLDKHCPPRDESEQVYGGLRRANDLQEAEEVTPAWIEELDKPRDLHVPSPQELEDVGKWVKETMASARGTIRRNAEAAKSRETLYKETKDAPLPSAQEIEDARNSWLGDTEAIRHRRLEQLGNQNSAKVVGIDSTLVERRKIHGDFSEHARIAQNLKSVMRNSLNWRGLSDRQHEALEMLAHKIGRVLAGDPNHPDHWHDIQGYARLIERYLTNEDAA